MDENLSNYIDDYARMDNINRIISILIKLAEEETVISRWDAFSEAKYYIHDTQINFHEYKAEVLKWKKQIDKYAEKFNGIYTAKDFKNTSGLNSLQKDLIKIIFKIIIIQILVYDDYRNHTHIINY